MRIAFIIYILTFLSLEAKDYRGYPQVQSMINTLVEENHFKREELEKLFSQVEVQHDSLHAFVPSHKAQVRQTAAPTAKKIRQAKILKKFYGPWDRYAKSILSTRRIIDGVSFVKKHENTFLRVEKKYGIPKEYIAAIVGIESAFGKNVGKYPLFDTLVTLAFEENRRNKFFKKELMEFLKLFKRQKLNPKNAKGSYAGAMGLVQFLPSNYEYYGVDFDGDGRISLQCPDDAIASVANYFKKNGWRKGEPVAIQAKYKGRRFSEYETGYKYTYNSNQLKGITPMGAWSYTGKIRLIKLERKRYDELWFGAKNFFVITRYNHSSYYAMAVHQLAQRIKAGLLK